MENRVIIGNTMKLCQFVRVINLDSEYFPYVKLSISADLINIRDEMNNSWEILLFFF